MPFRVVDLAGPRDYFSSKRESAVVAVDEARRVPSENLCSRKLWSRPSLDSAASKLFIMSLLHGLPHCTIELPNPQFEI